MAQSRDPDQIIQALRLKETGLTARAVSEATGVSVNTIRIWLRNGPPQRVTWMLQGTALCQCCGLPAHDPQELPAATYAYLLGMYLGDGCLTAVRGSWNLRISLDGAYPGIIEECRSAVERVRGRPPAVCASRRDRSMIVSSNWVSWCCLFPQHGPGRKHERPISLHPWQQALVDEAPGSFVRGLIHTDGWRGANHVVSKGKAYSYPRYQFSNRSDDIRRIFTDTCDAMGVEWRQWTRFHVSVAKRASVALLDEFVGPKY